jgi:hypothetical protein
MRQARRFATSDEAGLLIVGTIAAVRAFAYTPLTLPPETKATHPAEAWVSMDVWSVVWGVVAVLCFAAAVAWRTRPAAVAFGAIVGLHALFGFSFLFATLSGDMGRGWVSANSYVAISFLVLWGLSRREPREDVKPEGALPRADPQ